MFSTLQMKSRVFALAVCITVGVLPFALRAQPASARPDAAQGGEVRGRIVAAVSAVPIPTAMIDVAPTADSTRVVRTKAQDDGTFRVGALPFGRYRVQVRALGFAFRRLPDVTLSANTASRNLGDIALTPIAIELQKVTVADQRREAQLSPDRNTYVVRDMPTTKGGSALDVLRTVPAVDVDMDNLVSLRGNSGVVVQINGRASPMKPGPLGNFLAQLPAAMVDKVEVISNPSARDNPEGSAGIINIVLKRKSEPGSSVGLTVAQGTTGRTDVGANGSTEVRDVSMFGSYGFSHDVRKRSESLYRENTYATPLTLLEQSGLRQQKPNSHTVTSTLEYALGDKDELAADLLFSTRREDGTTNLLYRDLDASRQLTGLHDRVDANVNKENSFESALSYTHKFGAKRHELAAEYTLQRDSEGGPNAFRSQLYALNGTPSGVPSLESSEAVERPLEQALKVDYVKPFGDRVRLQAGYRSSLIRIRTSLDTRVFDATSAVYVSDPTRSNDFRWTQGVHAAYGMMSGTSGKVQLQGGVRVERANTQFHLTRSGVSYDNHYNSFYPSGLVVYNVDESSLVKVSYSTRVSRPDDPEALDPTPHVEDPLNLSRGDPHLKPEYTRALELGVQRLVRQSTLQVTPFYRHTIDAVRRIRTVDGAGVTTTTFANVATFDVYGTDATLALHEGRFSGFVGSSAFRQSINADNLGAGYSVRTFGWSARTNIAMKASRTVDLQTSITYRGRVKVEQGSQGSLTRVNLAARKKLNGDRVNVTLRITDPFRTDRERSFITDPRFYQESRRFRNSRGVLLNVTWNFGKPVKEKGLDEGEPPPAS